MSSAPDTDTKLPARAEALLADWPLSAPPDWEALATRIVARAQAGVSDESGEDLLRAPFAAEQGEPGFEQEQAVASVPTASQPTATAPVSLAALARASVNKKNQASKDIALESLAVASQARAHVGEIAERQAKARASAPDLGEAQAKPAAPMAVAAVAPAVAAHAHGESPGVQPAAAPTGPARAPSNVSRGPWIVSGIAALAAAAALVLAVGKTEGPSPLVQTHLPPATQPVVATASPAAGTAASPSPELSEPKAAALPAAERPASPGGVAAGVGVKLSMPAPSAAGSGVKPEQIVLEDEEARAEAPAPAPAPAPPSSAQMRPAELPSGGLPDKPASGAVNAAVGSVMGTARACIAGHDEPSSARIVFGSDGSVQSVNVSGPAAGTPAAACIQTAFKRARVQPFAAPTFSISTTVRPN